MTPEATDGDETYGNGRFVALAGLLELRKFVVGDLVAGLVRHGAALLLLLLLANLVPGAVRESGWMMVSEVWVARARGH